MKTKKLILNIDERVEKELVTNLMVKRACASDGSIRGIENEFIFKILQALNEKDTKEITITLK